MGRASSTLPFRLSLPLLLLLVLLLSLLLPLLLAVPRLFFGVAPLSAPLWAVISGVVPNSGSP